MSNTRLFSRLLSGPVSRALPSLLLVSTLVGCGAYKDSGGAATPSTYAHGGSPSPMSPGLSAHGGEVASTRTADAPAKAEAPAAPPTGGPASATTGADMAPPAVAVDGAKAKRPVIEVLPPIPLDQESPTGGVLTAAVWDDNKHRDEFVTFLNRYPSYREEWGMDMRQRIQLRVEDSAGVLVADAPIAMRLPDGRIVNMRTHGDGTAWFYPKALPLAFYGPNGPAPSSAYALAAQVGSLRAEASFASPTADSTTWTVRLPGVPARSSLPAMDLAIVLDTTGSMGDEIGYIQRELEVIIKRAKLIHGVRRMRLGLVLYKDRGDEYVTKSYPFTEDMSAFMTNLRPASAGGGGDMPESVNAALADTVSKLGWAGDESARMAILIADAPPHYYADETYTYKNALVDLNARGIKLVTLGCSGIDKTTEYVFREMSAYTGGRYTFLTDDSGVGGSHIIPDISGYQVERLDRMMVRVITDELKSFDRK